MGRTLFAAGVLLTCCRSALALNPALDVSQYAHTSWKIRDGFFNGNITCFALPPGQSLPSTYIRSLLAARDGTLWIGTLKGLVNWKNARLTRYPELNDQLVNSLVEDRDGMVWIGSTSTPTGRLCAIRRSILECERESGRFGAGVVTIYEDRGRTLWVGTTTELWRWMPGPPQLPFNRLPPPVPIDAITADRTKDDVSAAVRGGIRMPPLVRDPQIDYAALSLVDPERNEFRYKLEGFDPDWQGVGNRRQAFYTNLPPRGYRFRVIASNNSGVWNEAGAFVDFTVAPAYYQTMWFAALAIVAIIGLAWSAHTIRVRIIETHESEISALNERLMKRRSRNGFALPANCTTG